MHVLLTVYTMTTLAMGAADTTFAVGDASRLVINAQRGDVVVRTWDRDAIDVSTSFGSEAMTISRSGRTIRLTQRHDYFNETLHIQVMIPSGLAVDVEGVFSSIDIAGVDHLHG